MVGEAVQPVEPVQAEEVALSLDHVGSAARGAHTVKPGKSGGKGGQGMAMQCPSCDDQAQGGLAAHEFPCKARSKDEAAGRVFLQRLRHAVEHPIASPACEFEVRQIR